MKTKIDVDLHTHVLPYMDDGAANSEMSRKMLLMFRDQGIRTVAATSHFDFRKESAEDFISRRTESMKRFYSECETEGLPEVIPGAEVHLMPGLSSIQLEPLCYKDTNYVLIEMPHLPFSDRFISELEVLVYKQKLVPVVAHIDRYMEWYSESDVERLLSFEEAIFQINNHAFFKKSVCRPVTKIIKDGYPVVLGSDAHDSGDRRPNFDLLDDVMGKHYYQKHIVPAIIETTKEILK